jgi:hypothetical protein
MRRRRGRSRAIRCPSPSPVGVHSRWGGPCGLSRSTNTRDGWRDGASLSRVCPSSGCLRAKHHRKIGLELWVDGLRPPGRSVELLRAAVSARELLYGALKCSVLGDGGAAVTATGASTTCAAIEAAAMDPIHPTIGRDYAAFPARNVHTSVCSSLNACGSMHLYCRVAVGWPRAAPFG